MKITFSFVFLVVLMAISAPAIGSTMMAYTYNNQGDSFLTQGKYEDAINAYNNAIESDPQYISAWNSKGVALARLGMYDDAIEAYEITIEYYENKTALAWFNKGAALANQGKHEDAIQAYDKAIELSPHNEHAPNWYNNKGTSLYLMGGDKFEEAVQTYDKAIELDQNYSLAWRNKGFVLLDLNSSNKAMIAFDRALELNPSDGTAWYGKGLALKSKSLGQDVEAEAALEKAEKLGFITSDIHQK